MGVGGYNIMDFEQDLDDSRISKINAASLINLTLKDLWEDFYRHLRNLAFSKANADLDCLWVEFGGEEKDGSETWKEFNKIDQEVSTNYGKIPLVKGGFDKNIQNASPNFAKQYRLLLRKALFLKNLQNSQGKGTAYRDGAEDYMDI